jgi:RimJ/RimL family protein N-acetyltransferase
MKLIKTTLPELKPILIDSQSEFLPTKDTDVFDIYIFLSQFENEKHFFLFSFVDDSGNTLGFISNISYDDQLAAIGPMYILPSHRGKGLSEAMLRLFIKWTKEYGFKQIKTKTWGENKASRHLFEKLRFEIVKEKRNDRKNGDSTITYMLQLH